MSSQPRFRRKAHQSTRRVRRRTLLGGVAALAVLAACGRQVVAPGVEPDQPSAPANVPAIAPPQGVQFRAPGIGGAIIAPAIPTPAVVQSPATPTAVATATAVPAATSTPVPSPTPLVFNAARLTHVLGSAQTSYAGSIPPRAHNVRLATKRLNQTKVAPGEIYSFNEQVGETTLASGYQIGYGISLVNGQTGTVPSVAGGICQVSTTLFQAAYWAGLAIVQRYYHRYWIPRYGQPPSGRTGFDATVDDPHLDFRFKNTTSDWIIVEAWTDAANVYMVIRGVDPGWEVQSTRPIVTNIVKANQTLVRQEDPTLPAGQELLVEHAEDGFSVSAERTVIKDGQVVERYRFTNHYVPARNVLLVGTKGATPTPVPTATPTTPTPADPVVQPTPTAAPAPPTPRPDDLAKFKLANGRISVPSVVGMREADARGLVERVSLTNTYTNYQGAGDVPAAALEAVPPGHVLSQSPAPGSHVLPGTTVYLAVRKP